jgi:hypothetical protein
MDLRRVDDAESEAEYGVIFTVSGPGMPPLRSLPSQYCVCMVVPMDDAFTDRFCVVGVLIFSCGG